MGLADEHRRRWSRAGTWLVVLLAVALAAGVAQASWYYHRPPDAPWPVPPPVTEPPGTQPPVTEPPSPPPAPPPRPGIPPVSGLAGQEATMVQLVNAERVKAGLRPLTVDPDLTALARLKAQDIARLRYWSHTSPTYGSVTDMLRSFGVSFRQAGENLSQRPDVNTAHWRLMASPVHRANILFRSYTHVGIGVVPNGGLNVYVQIFVTR